MFLMHFTAKRKRKKFSLETFFLLFSAWQNDEIMLLIEKTRNAPKYFF